MSLWKKKCSASLGLGEMRTETLQGCHGCHEEDEVVGERRTLTGGRNVASLWKTVFFPKLTTVHCGRGRSLRQSEKHSSPVV